ncbi:hypothetical protein ACJ72_01850 [Emergomyces africanus]|uniref:NmrA-like domain-containing protein n=1 Tax=Emergomyces africanus TaxID=1955775 RepID=A0A1B7P438_9EURO|nr:hypothetical protein ACJ72_01850 [Emergomyces africanus]
MTPMRLRLSTATLTLKNGFLGFDIPNKTATYWDERYTNNLFSTARLTLVADAVAQSLSPALAPKTANQVIAVRDATISLADILKALETATGSPWTRNLVDLDDLVEQGKAKIKKGDFSGVPYMIVRCALDAETEGNFDERGIVANELLGVETWGLQKVVDAVVAEVNAELKG